MIQLIAQSINNPALGPLGGLNGSQFFSRLLPALISIGFVGGVIVFTFMIIVGGIEWISSGGDKVSYENARKRITNALIGITILFGFFAILSLVECFFGIGLRRFTIGPFNIRFIGAPFCS